MYVGLTYDEYIIGQARLFKQLNQKNSVKHVFATKHSIDRLFSELYVLGSK